MAPFSRAVRNLAGRILPGGWTKALGDDDDADFLEVRSMVMRDLIRPGHVVFDVGAGTGRSTALMSALVGPRGRVVAFEAREDQSKKIALHLQSEQQVMVEHAALWETGGGGGSVFSLFRTEVGPVLRPGWPEEAGGGEAIEAPLLTLDDYREQHGLNPSFLKLSVDGLEGPVLRGGMRLLQEVRPAIVMEASDFEAFLLLQELDFDLWDLCRVRPFDPANYHPGPGSFTYLLALHHEARPYTPFKNWPRLVGVGVADAAGTDLGPGRYLSEVELDFAEDPDVRIEVRCKGMVLWRGQGLVSSDRLLRHQVFELIDVKSRVSWSVAPRTPQGRCSLRSVRVWRVEGA